MQDLGRITIDVNETPGSGGVAAAGGGDRTNILATARGVPSVVKQIVNEGTNLKGVIEIAEKAMKGATGTIAKSLMGLGIAVGVALIGFGLLVAGVKKAVDALKALHRFVMGVAEELGDFSPSIAFANMGNEIAMVFQKFRLGMTYGPAIAGQVRASGRVERAMLSIQAFLAAVGASFLEPITNTLADVLEQLQSYFPAILDGLQKLLNQASEGLITSGLAAMGFLPPTMMPIAGGLIGLGGYLNTVSNNVAKIARNTAPQDPISEMNRPFLDDLRLMGARI